MERSLIAIIDDDQEWVRGIAQLLHDQGIAVVSARDGQAGLHLLDYSIPSMIVLDVELPKISGLEILKELRRNGRDIPVVLVSGIDNSGVVAEAMEQGATVFLRKPVAAGILLRTILRLLPNPVVYPHVTSEAK